MNRGSLFTREAAGVTFGAHTVRPAPASRPRSSVRCSYNLDMGKRGGWSFSTAFTGVVIGADIGSDHLRWLSNDLQRAIGVFFSFVCPTS